MTLGTSQSQHFTILARLTHQRFTNVGTAAPGMFANSGAAGLHLLASATNAIDKRLTLSAMTNGFDGDRRLRGASSDLGADEFTTNAPPRIADFGLSGTNCVLRFATFLGESYDVQRAADLTGGTWSLVASNLSGTGETPQITDTNARCQPLHLQLLRPR